MEQLIAIILVIIMIIIDYYKPEDFKNFKSCLNNNLFTLKPNIVLENKTPQKYFPCSPDNNVSEPFEGKINVWVLNNYVFSSIKWNNFGSRNNNVHDIALTDLCIESIKKHFNPQKYNIKIINQDNISTLIPEYNCYIKECNSYYIFYNLVKYAILNKYGGIWIPNDTLILRDIKYNNILHTNYIITYGNNNTTVVDNAGYNDNILGTSTNNLLVNNMLSYLKANLNTFQNSVAFKNSINKYFNKLLSTYNNHIHTNILAEKTTSGRFLSKDDLFSTNLISIEDFPNKSMINIGLEHIKEFHKYNYILRMDKSEIINSNLFLAYLIKSALF